MYFPSTTLTSALNSNSPEVVEADSSADRLNGQNVPPHTPTMEGGHNPTKAIFDGVMYSVKNSFIPYNLSETNNNHMECRLKKKSKCFVLKKGGQLSDEDHYLYYCACCSKMVHLDCYREFMKENTLLHLIQSSTLNVVCGKRCFQKTKKNLYTPEVETTHGNQTTKFWDNDAEQSSISILLEWLTEEANSTKYFGAPDNSSKHGFSIDDGITRSGLCKNISEIIKSKNGIERSPDSIRSKIDDLVGRFKATNDWICATGQGVRESEGESKFKDLVIGKFRYYYELEPILIDRPSIRPSFTTDELEDEEDMSPDEDESSVEEIVTPSVTRAKRTASLTNSTTAASSANSAKKAFNEIRKRAKMSSPVFQFGSSESIDSFMNQKNALYEEKDRNEKKKIEVETQRLEFQKEMDNKRIQQEDRRLEAEAQRLEMEKKRFSLEADIMRSKNKVTIAENNIKILKLRQEALQINPQITKEELDRMFSIHHDD